MKYFINILRSWLSKIRNSNLIYTFVIGLLFFIFFYSRKRITWKNHYISDKLYAVVVDCGSTGSRLHIYTWKKEFNNRSIPDVRRLRDGSFKEISYKIHKPLSSFADTPEQASEPLIELIEKSYQFIPKKQHSWTSLDILATGGMRLIDDVKANAIFSSLKTKISAQIRYKLHRVELISGKMEGAFMWVGLNHVLGSFQNSCGKNTHGTFEVGGASMQLAFEIDNSDKAISSFTYFCAKHHRHVTHHIFATTFLGLGANSAYHYYTRSFTKATNDIKNFSNDPCLATNCQQVSNDHIFRGTGHPEKCFKKISQTFDKYFQQQQDIEMFELFKNKYHSSSKRNTMTFYGLSEPFYSFHHFLRYQGPLLPSIYWKHSKDFCEKDCEFHRSKLFNGFYGTRELKHLVMQCFKVPYIRFLIEKFLPPSLNNPIISIDNFQGETIDWTFGAMVFFITQEPS